MSWLSIPLPNPFKSLQSDDPQPHIPSPSPSPDQDPSDGGGGVKEDLSVLGETIGRQLRGVASFLAPPPSSSATTTAAAAAAAAPVEESSYDSSSQALLGIRNDLVEIGGSFKSGLSLLSGNKAVSGISRFASNLLQLGNEDDDDDGGGGGDEGGDWDEAYGGVAGITEEVVDFAREISTRPECWIDFPLSLDNDFNMSDAQREHALTIERLAPGIAALRVKLRSDMSEELFWMIYFILLLPRLDEHHTKLLSTPEIGEARAILLQKLQTKSNSQVNSERSKTLDSSQVGSETRGENSPMQEKEVLADTVKAAQVAEMDEQEHVEQWLEGEDDTGTSVNAQKQLENEEDVSFSDLEDDDNDFSGRQLGLKPAEDDTGVSSPNGSNDWVQLNESSETHGGQQKAGQSISRGKDSEGEEPNDWLTVDDFD